MSNIIFIINSLLLGVGLAMDAFSVSLANGLNEPQMKKGRMCLIAGVFGFFQWVMPVIGWLCVHTIIELFSAFEKAIPFIALILLLFIGGNMLREGIVGDDEGEETVSKEVGIYLLAVQGVATSIDALSVGFTIADYHFLKAFIATVIIGIVTFFICMVGLHIGKTAGTRLGGKAQILGGLILIGIGLEIFIRGVLL